MSAVALSPFIPPHALRIWADRERIYVAYPAANQGADYVVDYPNDTRGLSLVLASMVKAYSAHNPLPKYTASPATRTAPAGVRKHKAGPPAKSSLTDDDRHKALAALIAAGVLPPTAGN